MYLRSRTVFGAQELKKHGSRLAIHMLVYTVVPCIVPIAMLLKQSLVVMCGFKVTEFNGYMFCD